MSETSKLGCTESLSNSPELCDIFTTVSVFGAFGRTVKILESTYFHEDSILQLVDDAEREDTAHNYLDNTL